MVIIPYGPLIKIPQIINKTMYTARFSAPKNRKKNSYGVVVGRGGKRRGVVSRGGKRRGVVGRGGKRRGVVRRGGKRIGAVGRRGGGGEG